MTPTITPTLHYPLSVRNICKHLPFYILPIAPLKSIFPLFSSHESSLNAALESDDIVTDIFNIFNARDDASNILMHHQMLVHTLIL